jgi:hypothetical protein
VVTRAVADLAPETITDTTETTGRGRHVAHYASTVERPGAVVLHGPDHDLAAIFNHLDVGARAARKAGAPETLDQLRFDLAVGHLTAGAYGLTLVKKPAPRAAGAARSVAQNKRRRRVRSRSGTTLINITAAGTTMLGLDNQPAVLHTPSGDVPIPADPASGSPTTSPSGTGTAAASPPAPPAPSSSTTSRSSTTRPQRSAAARPRPTWPLRASVTTRRRPTGWST